MNHGLLMPFTIVFIMLFSIYPSIVYAEGNIWYRQIDTIVLQNSSENVYIGENATTTYRLRVNGSFYADSLFGDGGNLTNITTSEIDPVFINHQSFFVTNVLMNNWNTSYNWGNDFNYSGYNQNLNTTDNVNFSYVNATSLFGDGGNITNITATGDGYSGDTGHPHNQDLNTSSYVNFGNITIPYNYISVIDEIRCLFFGITPHRGKIYQERINERPPYEYILTLDNYEGHGIILKTSINSENAGDYDLKIDATGVITSPHQSTSRAWLYSPVTSSSGWSVVPFDTESFDKNNDFNTGSYRFVCPHAGVYLVSYVLELEGFLIGDKAYGLIYKNGVSYGGYSSLRARQNGEGLVITATDMLDCSTNDYINIYWSFSGIGTRTLYGGVSDASYISVCKLT